jgi:hypothetical protein
LDYLRVRQKLLQFLRSLGRFDCFEHQVGAFPLFLNCPVPLYQRFADLLGSDFFLHWIASAFECALRCTFDNP